MYVAGMGLGQITNNRSIVIPRLEDPSSASPDERDEHLMLLEAARHSLEVEFIRTLAVADSAGDHHLSGHPSTVAYLRDRQISSDEAALLFRAAASEPDRYQKAETVLLELVGESFEEYEEDPGILAEPGGPRGGAPRAH